jgi:hypothetical protein
MFAPILNTVNPYRPQIQEFLFRVTSGPSGQYSLNVRFRPKWVVLGDRPTGSSRGSLSRLL